MGTPGDSPGSESSPPAVARGGCLRKDKNQVRVQRQILQTVQGIHELDVFALPMTLYKLWQLLGGRTHVDVLPVVPLVCSPSGSSLWLRSAPLSCIIRDVQASVPGDHPHASPGVAHC